MVIELIFEFEPDFEKSKSGSPAAAARKPMVQVGSQQLQRQTRHRSTTCRRYRTNLYKQRRRNTL